MRILKAWMGTMVVLTIAFSGCAQRANEPQNQAPPTTGDSGQSQLDRPADEPAGPSSENGNSGDHTTLDDQGTAGSGQNAKPKLGVNVDVGKDGVNVDVGKKGVNVDVGKKGVNVDVGKGGVDVDVDKDRGDTGVQPSEGSR